MGSQEPRQVSRVREGATYAGRHDRACGAERTSHLVERKRCGQCFPKGSREARLTPAEDGKTIIAALVYAHATSSTMTASWAHDRREGAPSHHSKLRPPTPLARSSGQDRQTRA